MLEIKSLPQNKWEDYQKLRLEALDNDSIAFISSYEEEIKLSKKDWQKRIGNVLFALSDNEPIGMVVYVFNNRIKIRHIANIYGLYVSKEYRNQGVGDRLLGNALSIIEGTNGIFKIRVSVIPQQIYAVKLYEKYGFATVGRLINELIVDDKYYDELLMEKRIQK
jgi:ribosomal protein S18 acetylase RimI-like enzyme